MAEIEHDVNFESTDAGASTTYPLQAGSIRKNGFISIKGRPYKVVDVSTSKTGKHGHAKCHFVGIDIFTGKKAEELVPSSHNCEVPHVNRSEYTLLDIQDDGYVSLMPAEGDTRDDLKLPELTDEDKKLSEDIQKLFTDGQELLITVLKAMNEEKIIAHKVNTTS